MLIYICEDNTTDLRTLYEHINEIAHGMQIPMEIELFNSAEDLLEEVNVKIVGNDKLPDIVFSDIKMSGMNGIDLGKRLIKIAPEIVLVYLTAYEEYAIQGYETRAYRYLLKPVVRAEIVTIIEDIYRKYDQNHVLKIHSSDKEMLISVKDIRYISAEDKYSVIHTTKGSYLDRKSLSYFEKSMEGMTFFRVHRKYLVNVRFHKGIKNGSIILDNDEIVPISRRKKADYHAYLIKLLEGDLLR